MIDVALTRVGSHAADTVIVVDTLRATSTVAQALAAGYPRVLCAESIERATALRAEGRVLAGEVECVKPPGFDQGNSPLEAAKRVGDELVLATTNGAPAILEAAGHSPTVILACMLNLEAVLKALRESGVAPGGELLIVCAGTDGAPALEDTYVAGRLSSALPGHRSDTALIAESVARAYSTPLEALTASADARVLRDAGLEDDIAHCAGESELDIVPRVSGASDGVAVVSSSGATEISPTDLTPPIASTP